MPFLSLCPYPREKIFIKDKCHSLFGKLGILCLSLSKVACCPCAVFHGTKPCHKSQTDMKVGDLAPDVWGVNQNGKEIRRSDYQGRKVALYFYPKDNTSGCTAEACNLRDGYEALRAAGYEVVGVSKDSEASHRKFIEKQSLPFDLIADTDTSLNQTFGVWTEKKLYGRAYMGTARTTFIIDENGVVERIIDKVDTKNHADQILNNK